MARTKGKRERVTGAELARRLGVAQPQITKAVAKGRIVRGDDGLFDAEESIEAFASSSTRPPESASAAAQAVRRSPTEAKTKHDWSVAKEREQYLKLRLERRELQGSLVKREVVEHEFAELATMVRDRFRGIGKRLRDQLAAEVDPRRCGELVEAEVDATLKELSTARKRKAP